MVGWASWHHILNRVNDGFFRSYNKPDDIIQYVNKGSNHTLNLIKHLPTSIEKRLSNNSSDKKK